MIIGRRYPLLRWSTIPTMAGISNGKPPSMKPFNPVEHGLNQDFVLTNFTKMKG